MSAKLRNITNYELYINGTFHNIHFEQFKRISSNLIIIIIFVENLGDSNRILVAFSYRLDNKISTDEFRGRKAEISIQGWKGVVDLLDWSIHLLSAWRG